MFDKIGSTSWNTHENGWHQKIYINKSGQPIYTYYYQSKSSKPGITIEINTNLSRQYCAYILIEKDLQDILDFIDILLELINVKEEKNDLLIKGLSRAILITYGKCFTQADGRRIKLGMEVISKEYKEIHNKLMDMRHNYVAHAGISQHEFCRGILVLPSESKARKLGTVPCTYFSELRQTLTTQIIVLKETKQHIKHILDIVKQKLAKKCSLMQETYDNLDLAKIYKMAKKKNSKRIVINDEDIKTLYR
ncbi:MAG TPA: hypothetical protein VFF04_03215 [Candidatus Babeliales bacterium]|nr:hypothetical protein [Candidatus Babeliales bacterium]